MKKAGDVAGVPQWQTETLLTGLENQDQEIKKDAADSLREAGNRLGECISWADSAAYYVDGMPEADRIISLINSMDEIQRELEKLMNELGGGEKE